MHSFYPAKLDDFKRLSLGGYGGLRCIKSIWVDSPGPGDKTPRLVVSNDNVYSRDGARKRGPFHGKRFQDRQGVLSRTGSYA